MFKIEKLTEGTATVLRLVGRINTQHLDELRKLISDAEPYVKLDLSEVTLVDVDVIRFLGIRNAEAFSWVTVRATSESGFRGSKRQTQSSGPEAALMQSEEGG